SKYEADPFNEEKRVNVVNLVNQYNDAAKDELKLLHQTAKVKWFKVGDRNSTFFHSILKARKHKSRVESICGEDGERVPVKLLSELGDIVQMKLNGDEAKSMIGEISEEEIINAMFDIQSSKVVGPNGFTSCFLKKLGTTLARMCA
nr:hypothetical protein [Tanacetum cinerariifolium]